jgi:hypothetical protein
MKISNISAIYLKTILVSAKLMADRSLNESLDMHIARNKSDVQKVEKKKNFFAKVIAFFKRIKEYFFPPEEYEETTFSHDALTVVHKAERGFKHHMRKIKHFFSSKEKK